ERRGHVARGADGVRADEFGRVGSSELRGGRDGERCGRAASLRFVAADEPGERRFRITVGIVGRISWPNTGIVLRAAAVRKRVGRCRDTFVGAGVSLQLAE